MARVVRCLAVLTMALGALAFAATAGAQPPPQGGGPITVSLPPGTTLAPGQYTVVIQGPDQEIRATAVVPPAGATGNLGTEGPDGTGAAPQPVQPGQQQSTPATATSGGGSGLLMIGALVLALLAIAGAVLYLKVLVPRKQVRAYLVTLALVEAKRYEEALPRLTQTESKLPERLQREARFFIAFSLFQLGEFDGAGQRLAEQYRERPEDENVAYLLAYLRAERRDYDRAEPILEGMESRGQLGVAAAKRLYGIVKFQRALKAFHDGRIEAAAELFEKVEELGDFRDQIPPDLRNQHIVLGAQALFEKAPARAREHFHGIERAADSLDAAQEASLLATAKLGFALAAWIEDEADSAAQIENFLTDAARLLDPSSELELPWPEDDVDTNLTDRLGKLEQKATRPAELAEIAQALRDIHFLRGAAVLRSWIRADQADAKANESRYHTAALARFACARDRDPEFGDTYLVAGLLAYYLAKTDHERARAVALLRKAQRLGIRAPEALQIINHHDRLRAANKDAVEEYLQVLDSYLRDGTVRRQVREALIERLSRYGRVRDWDTRPEFARVRTVEPTVAEIRSRSGLLLEHLRQLTVSPHEAAEFASARDLTSRLERESRELFERARSIEEKEAELLLLVGDRLLPDLEG